MDNWNRPEENAYTGISAQRRNRRRTARAPQEEQAPAKTVDPTAYMRPEIPAEPEKPVETEESTEPAAFTEPEEITEPEETAAEVTEEPAEPEKPEAAVAPEEPEKPEEPEEPAAPAEEAKPAEPETPAEPEAAVQGPDSRIPAKARRMAEAPYGPAGDAAKIAEQRTAMQRPVRTGERRPQERPRGEVPAGRTGGEGDRPRVRIHVGYAPGRMSDEMTRQVPAADETVRQPISTSEARAYLEKRNNPFREGGADKMPNRPGHKALRIAVALLVIAGLVLTGWMLFRGRDGKDPVIAPQAPQVLSYEPPVTEGLVAPVELVFSVTTDKSVGEIRLRAEGDVELDTAVKYGDNADGRIWMIKMPVEKGFDGKVILQVRRNEEDAWTDTEYSSGIAVSSPLGMDTDEDTDEDTGEDGDSGEDTDGGGEGEGGDAGRASAGIAVVPETAAPEQGKTGTGTEPRDEDEPPAGELKTPAPTETPAPETPEPTATPPLTVEAAKEASPDLITNTTVYTSFTKKAKDYNRPAKELIHMPAADEYTSKRLGVMTFRGDNFRRNAAVGTLSAAPLSMGVMWQTEGGSARGTNQTYYGYEWTGQPVIARWSTEVRAHSNITEAKIEKSALKEVIIAGMDGWIRFLDLEDGKITRNSIKLGYPFRGTPSLHSNGYPFMTVGQFARKMKVRTGRIGLRQYNLFTQTELKLIDGLDDKYHRPVNDIGSFETSALVDRTSDTLITVGTNGMLYLEALNSTFDYNLGVLTTAMSTTTMTNKVKGRKDKALTAVESSLAAYDRYVYYADMGGVLRCVDTNTLQAVWAVNTGDSVMAAVAMDLTEDRELNLYTANMLNNRKKGNSSIQIRRYDALSGREAWCTDVGVYKGKKDKDDVGAKASPVIGQHRLDSLVYYTVTGLSEDGRSQLGVGGEAPAALIALEKETGRVVWSFGMNSRSESSPIALYDDSGNGWILQCEQKGIVHLLDGLTGSEVCSLDLEAEIKASPAAYNNVVVIGTTGKNTSFIYGIEVKLDKPAEEPEAEQPQEEPAPEETVPEDETEETETYDEGPDEYDDWLPDGEYGTEEDGDGNE